MTPANDEQVRRLQDRLRVLSEAMRAFAEATTDYERLLDTVVKKLAGVLGDSCVLQLVSADAQWLTPVSIAAAEEETVEYLCTLYAENPVRIANNAVVQALLQTGEAFLANTTSADALSRQLSPNCVAHHERRNIHSVLSVALRLHGKPFGVLAMHRYKASSPPFDESDRDLAQNLADHAALAISNAQLLRSAQKELAQRKHAESRFAHLADAGLLGIAVGTMDGRILEVNDAVLKMLGYSREEIFSGEVHWGDLTPPDWRHVDQRAVQQLRAIGVSTVREKEYLRKDGTRVPVLLGSAMLEEDREVALSFILDLTERKRAEQTVQMLQKENAVAAKFRILLEAAPDAKVIVNRADRIILVNAQAERLFGYTREELLQHPIDLVIAPQSRSFYREHRLAEFSRATERAISPPIELGGRTKAGSEFPIEVSIGKIQTEDGELLLSAIRDITIRKQTETALKSANAELDAFCYSVAHDLRAPLRGMNGFAQVLLADYGDKLDAEGQDFLQEIHNNAVRMGALIDALLSLSRVTRSELKPERTDLAALVRTVAAELTGGEPERHVTVLAAGSAVADLDPRLARALIDNLVGNAWKFTNKTAAARIEFGIVDKDGGPVFFLRDNGAGFDMAYAAKLFTPFQRLHTFSEFPGTGIGLATVQRIIHRHGGRIWAEGQVGAGATFYFTFSETT